MNEGLLILALLAAGAIIIWLLYRYFLKGQ
jgi:hypothetical protein